MTLTEQLEDKLRQAFCPTQLVVRDDSAKHAGHAQAQAHGGAHIFVRLVCAQWANLSPVARHRAVYAVLAAEFAAGKIHALQLELPPQ